MKALQVTPECYPLIKTGGLADVTGALPQALDRLGCESLVLLPLYPQVRQAVTLGDTLRDYSDLFGGPARLLTGEDGGTPYLLLDAPHLYDRPGNPYLNEGGRDWPDNHLRFAALSWAARDIGLGEAGDWVPDVVHAHDWQAGLAPVYLAHARPDRPRTVLTIHNLAFQGLFPAETLPALRLPPESFTPGGVEFWGKLGFLKGGLVHADAITTVSPTYADEIRTPALGMGLDGVLRARSRELVGILNGIDTQVWDPASDVHLHAAYSPDCLPAKAGNKPAVQARFGLAADGNAPLFCVVSRLTPQKGIDLLLEVLPRLVADGGQLAVLGTGDHALEAGISAAAEAHRGRVGALIGYDEPLSHLLQAGADAILIPSRFEPCGLTQLIGLRYGTIPVAARTGGLADTIVDANPPAIRANAATGILFAPDDAEALAAGISRAMRLYRDPRAWQAMQRQAMKEDVGWSASARAYLELYGALLTRAVADGGRAAPIDAAQERRA